MTYTPHTTSYGHRALEFLRANGRSATAVLAEAIDCPSSSLHALMASGLAAGAFKKERVEGITYWDIGDGKPIERAKDIVLDKVGAEPQGGPPIPSVFDLGRAIVAPPFEGAPEPMSLPNRCVPTHMIRAASPTPTRFRCGAFTDGEVIVEKGGLTLVLTEEEAEKIRSFLNRLAEAAS